jgi:dihydroxyacetone kinase-like predicted kinase
MDMIDVGTHAPVDKTTAAFLLVFADRAVDELARAREEIDALNVFPVPDGDTGTNVLLTFSSARDALAEAVRTKVATGALDDEAAYRAFARCALLGARGNSGVILAEMLGALAYRMAALQPTERRAVVIVEAMEAASRAADAAVGEPVEGTILTVAREACAAARAALEAGGRTDDVLTAAADTAVEALARTPEQLPRLREEGVVDAGGRAMTVILEAAVGMVTGRRPSGPQPHPRLHLPDLHSGGDLTEGGPAYEVMYLLETDHPDDSDDPAIADLRGALAPLGDSLVITGRAGLFHVHVHVDDVGAAIEAGIAAGRPHRIRVTH